MSGRKDRKEEGTHTTHHHLNSHYLPTSPGRAVERRRPPGQCRRGKFCTSFEGAFSYHGGGILPLYTVTSAPFFPRLGWEAEEPHCWRRRRGGSGQCWRGGGVRLLLHLSAASLFILKLLTISAGSDRKAGRAGVEKKEGTEKENSTGISL